MSETRDLLAGWSHEISATPFYCPYCGEEDLRPVAEPHGAWRCADCLRTFTVRLVGIGVPSTVEVPR